LGFGFSADEPDRALDLGKSAEFSVTFPDTLNPRNPPAMHDRGSDSELVRYKTLNVATVCRESRSQNPRKRFWLSVASQGVQVVRQDAAMTL